MEDTFEEGVAQAQKALEKYSAHLASVLPALEQLHDAELNRCDELLWKLKEARVERAEGEALCAQGEEQGKAAQSKLRSLVDTLEALKAEDCAAVDVWKPLDLEALDGAVKSLRNQRRLVAKIMGIDLEEGSDTGDLTGVVHRSKGDKPFRVRTGGRSECDVADDLWNLLP